jgi:membrane-associated protease RseP (regulator of RpoE activity)
MKSWWPNLVLFVLTVGSTLLIGGPIYSIAILSILVAHEMGHYLASRKYGVPSSLPYFIPLPLPPFGTLGAVIRTKGPIPHRKALFDIGAWGPLCGLLIAIPAVIVGFLLSDVVYASKLPTESSLGASPLFSFLYWLTLGTPQPGNYIDLHPIAYAGWVGLFITSLNLLPTGQLDGGHIIYALFGRHSTVIFRLTLLGITLICLIYNLGWLLLVILLFFIGYRHPPPLEDRTPLDWRRKVAGGFAFLIFFTAFTPVPFPTLAVGLPEVLRSWLHL